MNIELRLREIMIIEDPGVQVTEGVMSRVGERPVPVLRNAGITHIADARTRRRSRFVLVGTVLVVAAAGAVLWMQRRGSAAPEAPISVADVVKPVPVPALEPEEPVAVVAPEAQRTLPPPPAPAAVPTAPLADLPLLPPHVFKDHTATDDRVLQKAVELYPDLAEGPKVEGDEMYYVYVVMRENGTVMDSAAHLTSLTRLEEFRDVSAEQQRMLPRVAGLAPGYVQRAQHTQLPDGRALRAEVVIHYQIIPDDYDLTRSTLKVDQLMRVRHPELFVSPKSGDLNRIIVLLTADGQIDREKIEQTRAGERPVINPAALQGALQGSGEPGGAARLNERVNSLMAERIATALGTSVDQIGLMGMLTVEEGSLVGIVDANGALHPDDQRRTFNVLYAWPRRAGESGPSTEEMAKLVSQSPEGLRQDLDREAVALTLAERLVPDAFIRKNADAGTPVIVLDGTGKVIGTMRVNTIGDEMVPSPASLRELQQLDPRFGVRPSTFSTETLRNKAGDTAHVVFAWLDPPPPQ